MTDSRPQMLFVKVPNYPYAVEYKTLSAGERTAIEAIRVETMENEEICRYFVRDVDFDGDARNTCSSIFVHKANCLLYRPTLCDWNSRLWLAHMNETVEKICQTIFARSLLPFFIVDGSEADGHIVDLLRKWDWKRIK